MRDTFSMYVRHFGKSQDSLRLHLFSRHCSMQARRACEGHHDHVGCPWSRVHTCMSHPFTLTFAVMSCSGYFGGNRWRDGGQRHFITKGVARCHDERNPFSLRCCPRRGSIQGCCRRAATTWYKASIVDSLGASCAFQVLDTPLANPRTFTRSNRVYVTVTDTMTTSRADLGSSSQASQAVDGASHSLSPNLSPQQSCQPRQLPPSTMSRLAWQSTRLSRIGLSRSCEFA